MRVIALVPAALILLGPAVAFGQDWARFVSVEDGFSANFPGKPTVTPITWDTEYRQKLPGRVYSAEDPLGRYSTTVVDYRGVQKLHDDAVAKCRAAKGARTFSMATPARTTSASTSPGRWIMRRGPS